MPAALAIVLGGVDVTTKVDMTSVTMQLAGSQDTASCEFDLIDTTNTVSATDEMTLTVTEVGTAEILFGGFGRSRRVVVIATGRLIHIAAFDYNNLLDRSIVVSDSRTAGESDLARLTYLMTTYGTQFSADYSQIATLNASMPAQKFVAITLRQAIERVLGQASTLSSYYIDATARLVTYDRSVPVAAPFDLVVGTPGAGEIAPDGDFSIDNDSSNVANAIYIVGATAAGSGWFTDVTSIGLYGRRERFFNAPDSDTAAKAMQVGLAVLEDQKNPVPRGVFTTTSPNDGWRIGQSITITSTQHGLSGAVYRIAKVSVRYLTGAGKREYTIEVGAPLPTLSALLSSAHGGGGGYPWHSPGGAGGWPPVRGTGVTGGTVDGSGCGGCPPWADACTPMRETFTRTVAAGSWGDSEFSGTAWAASINGGAASVDGADGLLAPTGAIATQSEELIYLPFAYPIHVRAKVKIVGPNDGGLTIGLGQPGVAGIGNLAVRLQETVGGSPNPFSLQTAMAGDAGFGSAGATIYPLGATDPLGLWVWVEFIMSATDVSVRCWLDGGSPGAYAVYTMAVGATTSLPTAIRFNAVTTTVGTTTANWRVTTIEILCDTPDTGREITDEFVAVGDGVRSTFTLQNNYAPRSTHIEVDNIHHIVTETNPATAAIDLGFAPIAGEVVTASYLKG